MKKVLFSVLLNVISTQAIAGSIGGISGGGGGTVTQNPTGRYTIEAILREARLPVFMFFNRKLLVQGANDERDLGVQAPNGALISDVIRSVKIYAKSDGPCFDASGNEVDGSIYAPTENAICISSKNLGNNLTDDNAFSQTLALVAHEYSHLIGATEAEADAIQFAALQEFNTFPIYRESLVALVYDFSNSWGEYSRNIPRSHGAPDYYQEVADFVNSRSHVQPEVLWSLLRNPLLTLSQREKVKVLVAKWEIIRLGVENLEWASTGDPKYSEFQKGFGDAKLVKVTDFVKTLKFFPVSPLKDSEVTVSKIENRTDVLAAWKNLLEEWLALRQEIDASHDVFYEAVL